MSKNSIHTKPFLWITLTVFPRVSLILAAKRKKNEDCNCDCDYNYGEGGYFGTHIRRQNVVSSELNLQH